MTSIAAYDSLTAADHGRELRKAVIAATVGTTIEWYDFFLYGTAAALVRGAQQVVLGFGLVGGGVDHRRVLEGVDDVGVLLVDVDQAAVGALKRVPDRAAVGHLDAVAQRGGDGGELLERVDVQAVELRHLEEVAVEVLPGAAGGGTVCQSPGNVQVNDAAAPAQFYPYGGEAILLGGGGLLGDAGTRATGSGTARFRRGSEKRTLPAALVSRSG